MNYKAKTAAEVTEPGAYEWVDEKGMSHVGFLQIEARGRIAGSFVAADGHSRAVAIKYVDGGYVRGTFYGPLTLPSANAEKQAGA